jgi:hypothetical protein
MLSANHRMLSGRKQPWRFEVDKQMKDCDMMEGDEQAKPSSLALQIQSTEVSSRLNTPKTS